MLKIFVLAIALPCLLQADFTWKDHKESGQLELLEDGRQVLIYNYGMQLPEGVPADRRRCCYLHPVNSPSGVTFTDDFPKDHYHHRGLFFGWAVVEHEGKTYDNWMLRGIGSRNEATSTKSGKQAGLEASNAWYVGDSAIVREIQTTTVSALKKGKREITVTVTLSAVGSPVVLKPVRDTHKSYGGLNVRFAPRTGTKIRADTGPVAKDEDLNPHRWVEYEAVYGGKRVSVRLEADPANPGGAPQWCLRHYGFAGAAFPGKTESQSSYTLEAGKTTTLTYRIIITDLPQS